MNSTNTGSQIRRRATVGTYPYYIPIFSMVVLHKLKLKIQKFKCISLSGSIMTKHGHQIILEKSQKLIRIQLLLIKY